MIGTLQTRKSWVLLMALLLFFLLGTLPLVPVLAESVSNPTVQVKLIFEDVSEDMIPQDKVITFLPDGIPFMAVSIHFDRDHDWEGAMDVIPGTQSLQIRDEQIDGLDAVVRGSIEEGYTITYYHQGESPEGTQPSSHATIPAATLPPVETSVVAAATQALSPQDEAAESSIQESLIAAEMEARGYDMEQNRGLYMAGIAVCVVLIIVVIILRIILARH